MSVALLSFTQSGPTDRVGRGSDGTLGEKGKNGVDHNSTRVRDNFLLREKRVECGCCSHDDFISRLIRLSCF